MLIPRSWLKQFIGETNGQKMPIYKDTDGVSGAILLAPSITQGI